MGCASMITPWNARISAAVLAFPIKGAIRFPFLYIELRRSTDTLASDQVPRVINLDECDPMI